MALAFETPLLLPAVVVLLATALVVLVFFFISQNSKRKGGKRGTRGFDPAHPGTQLVYEDGHEVRRSTRTRKSVSRWSPPKDQGTPGKFEGTPVKSTPVKAKTPSTKTPSRRVTRSAAKA